METEIRYYFNEESEQKIIDYLKWFNELTYKGIFYEKTDQYNHPMEKYNFYSKEIDGRFRIRKIVGDNLSKCMITWKRRLKNTKNNLIHQEEEVEVSIKVYEYESLIYLLTNVLHLSLVESYERYRSVFENEDVEIVVDRFPFGMALEIENKNKIKDAKEVIIYWVNKLKLDINKSYKLSWDDKYSELCKEQNKNIESIVSFNSDMPKIIQEFKLKKS